jgi:hypothetical protein
MERRATGDERPCSGTRARTSRSSEIARSLAQHPWIIDREFEFAAGRATVDDASELEAREEIRRYLANEVGDDLRAALFIG